ncbi:hypothetical protein [Mucilaginibacter sp. UYCu711]|uniref:hypothetical protein n=1 Tax=Mucilaginibacter sp. UYCu711 TaxID=3156339 RepID=UPI003D258D15
MVRDHIGGNPQISSAIPQDQQDDVYKEIAAHVNNGLQNQVSEQGGVGGLLSSLSGSLTSGSPMLLKAGS